MLNKNSKSMFFILLTPLYLLFFICIIGMSMGSIEWIDTAVAAFMILLAAYGLSRKNNVVFNLAGLLFLIGLGASLIYPTVTQTEHIGPWTINLYTGVALVIWGLIAFLYDVVKLLPKAAALEQLIYKLKKN